jgi:hypothetical protein
LFSCPLPGMGFSEISFLLLEGCDIYSVQVSRCNQYLGNVRFTHKFSMMPVVTTY